jgi:hypothetical protein
MPTKRDVPLFLTTAKITVVDFGMYAACSPHDTTLNKAVFVALYWRFLTKNDCFSDIFCFIRINTGFLCILFDQRDKFSS